MTRDERRSIFFALTLAVALLLAPLTARADAVRANGINTPGVEVLNIAGGELVYLTAAGNEVRIPLNTVERIELDRTPMLATGEQRLAEGNPAGAAAAFEQVANGARNDVWLRRWATSRRIAALDAAGRGRDAVTAYTALLAENAEPALLASPPVRSAAALSDADKQAVAPALTRAAGRAPASLRDTLAPLLAAVQVAPAADTPAAPAAGNTPTTPGTPAAPAAAPAGESATRLPGPLLVSDNPAAEMLRAGRAADAKAEMDRQFVNQADRLAERLFLMGAAQAALAEQNSAGKDAWLDAGLNFMKVAIYFQSSPLAGPALVEAARAHQQAGLPDDAARLLDEAEPMIDPEAEPGYAGLIAELRRDR